MQLLRNIGKPLHLMVGIDESCYLTILTLIIFIESFRLTKFYIVLLADNGLFLISCAIPSFRFFSLSI